MPKGGGVPNETLLAAGLELMKQNGTPLTNTKGDNRTWNLWFSENGPKKANGFHHHWKKYLMNGSAEAVPDAALLVATDGSVKSEVEVARLRISKAAGVPPTSVRISIDFG